MAIIDFFKGYEKFITGNGEVQYIKMNLRSLFKLQTGFLVDGIHLGEDLEKVLIAHDLIQFHVGSRFCLQIQEAEMKDVFGILKQ